MKTDDFTHTRHAIDFTEPSVDSNCHNIPRPQQEKRSKSIGVVAELTVAKKTVNTGSSKNEQQQRGTTSQWRIAVTAKALLDFWPISIETDGLPLPFHAFLQNPL
jgi:hypothetical protein